MSEKQDSELKMRFDLNVLQHLGLRMYTSLPAVVSEYVANAWDAWATEVEIEIPQDESMSPSYAITIEDNGRGMTKEEVNDEFLVVGRNRRQDEDKDYVEKDGRHRKVMGRKGIGKLAGFGIADKVQIRTCKEGRYVEFELDYGEMRDEAKKGKDATTTYRPTILDEGETNEASGTQIVLTNLDREKRPRAKYVRQRLARRFSVIGDDFEMEVNGTEVTGDERNLKERCEFLRTYEDEPIREGSEYTVDGWIGTLPKPTPDNVEGGVAVMARGKTAQKPITFGVAEGGTRGQMALQYLVGEVHADFLDDGQKDLIATHRNEVLWDKPVANELQDFLVAEIKEICSQWPEKRREEQMEEIRDEEPYQRYIKPLDDREQELADSFLGELAEKGDYDDDTLGEMASYVSSGVQQKSFQKLLEEIENSNISNTERLVELFDQYEVLDAMNSLRIVRGRFYAIQKFEELIEEGESNLKDLHGFISDNPWLIDPRWDYLDEELEVRKEIQKNFDTTDQPNRVGFISLGDADSIRLVDIRRTDYIIKKEDLDEFKDYIDFLRSISNMSPIDGRNVEGYIVASGAADARNVQSEIRRMKMDDMRIRTYDDIKDIARRSHQAFLDVFERKADRTESEMLQTYLRESEQIGLNEFSSGSV
ncbi:DNA mismatch repair protein MutL [Halorhabdus tiamatea SARL4B]|uniref:DNA mismatch repair protein MutL n=1 Tax=Halorhabdus tiamatea SARL4B TaxID=1033806 RepID=F7PGU8_9EURY|nr:ATP-binding protein [Halorhabdus tiamatea]ERJ06721.1 DNA mismatch repair protein MutL [Halorhabdus tiamatea SARL4B]CCQ33912.1 heat shock protein G homolog [Halorhabdus tiamatea SARL4B]